MLKLSGAITVWDASVRSAGRLKRTIGIPATLAARIIGMTVLPSLGTMMMPSTRRFTNVRTCSNCLFGSPSATASSIVIPRALVSARSRFSAATQNSVCRVSNATPIVSTVFAFSGALDPLVQAASTPTASTTAARVTAPV